MILPIRAAERSLPVREVTSEAMLVPNQDVPGFHRGYVYFIERSRMTLYSPDGRLALSKELERPNQRPLSVIGIAVDRNGTVAASWSQFPSADGKFAGIDLIDAAGKPIRTIETGAFLAGHVAFDDEHSIWAFGWQRDPNQPDRTPDDYMAVRKYSSDGRLLSRICRGPSFLVGFSRRVRTGRRGESRWHAIELVSWRALTNPSGSNWI